MNEARLQDSSVAERGASPRSRKGTKPYVIGIVALKGSLESENFSRLEANVKDVVKRLKGNFKGKTFEFHVVSPNQPKDLGESVGNRGHEDTAYWKLLEPLVTANNYDAMIGIADDYLEEASFNRQNTEKKCGVISVAEAPRFIPAGLSILDYLTYLVLCVGVLLKAGPEVKEHAERAFCLLDRCEERGDLTRGLAHASVNHCSDDLYDVGFTQEDVKRVNSVLRQVRVRDPLLAIAHSSQSVVPFLFGVALSFFTAVISALYPRTGLVLATTLFASVVALVLARIFIRSVSATHRRVLAEVVIGIAGVVLVGFAAWLGFILHIPEPADR